MRNSYRSVKLGAKTQSAAWNIVDQRDRVSDLAALKIRRAMNALTRSGSSPIVWNSATSDATRYHSAGVVRRAKRSRQRNRLRKVLRLFAA
jgi:hypothetical protein